MLTSDINPDQAAQVYHLARTHECDNLDLELMRDGNATTMWDLGCLVLAEACCARPLTCLHRGCLVGAELCTAGLCTVHTYLADLEVYRYTATGFTLAHLDPFQFAIARADFGDGVVGGVHSLRETARLIP